MQSQTWRWALGIIYIVAVALIWIVASFVVQSVVDEGVSPFLITYICNSLFVVYIPIVEIGRCLEVSVWKFWFPHAKEHQQIPQLQLRASENLNLLQDNVLGQGVDYYHIESASIPQIPPTADPDVISESEEGRLEGEPLMKCMPESTNETVDLCDLTITKKVDKKGRWTRTETAKISLLICPFWFLAQLTFNLSLKYTTVTSNTILSSTSSLFTFLVSLAFLSEKFTWMKLSSVLLCMAGTIIVSLGDSEKGKNKTAPHALLGDSLSLISAIFYAVYITLIRKKIPDEDKGQGQVSTAQFLGFLGLFNALIFLLPALILHFTNVEPFHRLTLKQFGLIVGKGHINSCGVAVVLWYGGTGMQLPLPSKFKFELAGSHEGGLLDNVLSDYLWARAVLLTTPTVATAGLSIQVPMAALVDSLTGNLPHLLDYLGGAAVLVGFFGINQPCMECCTSAEDKEEKCNHPQNSIIHDTAIESH